MCDTRIKQLLQNNLKQMTVINITVGHHKTFSNTYIDLASLSDPQAIRSS